VPFYWTVFGVRISLSLLSAPSLPRAWTTQVCTVLDIDAVDMIYYGTELIVKLAKEPRKYFLFISDILSLWLMPRKIFLVMISHSPRGHISVL
jgi:hypothetical protein